MNWLGSPYRWKISELHLPATSGSIPSVSMRSRRSFFRRLAVAAATVALAPQIAFSVQNAAKSELDILLGQFYELKRARMASCYSEEYICVMTDAWTKRKLELAFERHYREKIWKHR